MRVLYLHPNAHCYLAESLFHGLRSVLGSDCVDVPKYRSLYAPLTEEVRTGLRGGGFTLYGLLPDDLALEARRRAWREELRSYDLVVLARIWDQGPLFAELARELGPDRLVVVDGSDSPTLFPFGWKNGNLYRQPWLYFSPVFRYRYFKRELIGEGLGYGLSRLPRSLRRWMDVPRSVRPMAFSIPKEKIIRVTPEQKTKNFPAHIVDAEVAALAAGSVYSAVGAARYAFTNEADYVHDLQASRFGITTRRAGWDCLRHYELAANGCVLAFRDLNDKPPLCAPHGLTADNSVTYHDGKDLQDQLSRMSPAQYAKLQEASYRWISQNTTAARAEQFLQACQEPLS